MTLPGASIVEWTVDCRMDLVSANEVGATEITYLRVGGPNLENPRDLSKPLLPGLLWFTKGSRVNDEAKVLV